MSNVAFNNFTSGLVTPKLAGNYGSSIYHNGCNVLENFTVMLQGGITRRPPLKGIRAAHWGTNTMYRLIPFIIDVDHSYYIGLGHYAFVMFRYNATTDGFDNIPLGGADPNYNFWGTTPWPSTAVKDIQFAQSADTLYLVHPSYAPQKICLMEGETFFKCSRVAATLTKYTDAEGHTDVTYDPMNEDEGGSGDGDIFKTAGNYPSTVAFLNNRLWFANSDNHHIRYWASMPFDHEQFWYYKMVRVVNQTYSQDYINAYIAASEYSDSEKYAVGDSCLHNGILYKCKTAITTPEEWTVAHWDQMESSTSVQIRETVTEDCGIRFDASGNDAVCWISAKNNLIVGTASGEYAIPGAANGINYQLSDLSSYGSQKGIQPAQANGEILFVQCGGRKLRSITASSEGYSCLDLTYQCDRLLAEHNGVVRMAWRRVPDPTLYVVLGDGTMAVLFYDRGYGLCAWAHWTFKAAATGDTLAQVKDVIVIDTPTGQQTLVYVDRSGTAYIERFAEIDAADGLTTVYADKGTIPYTSEMVTNPYEYNSSTYGSSLGKRKRIRAFNCRLYKSKALEAGYGAKYMKGFSGSEGFNDIEIMLPGGYEDFVQMTVRSVGSDPLTVLAFSLDLEGEK